jgi:hypothetical protein
MGLAVDEVFGYWYGGRGIKPGGRCAPRKQINHRKIIVSMPGQHGSRSKQLAVF